MKKMITDVSGKRLKFILIWSIVIFTVLTISLGFILYNRGKEDVRAKCEKELTIISKMKIQLITNWMDERLADGYIFANNRFVISLLEKNTYESISSEEKNLIKEYLKILKIRYNYLEVFLLKPEGSLFFSEDSVLYNFHNEYSEDLVTAKKNKNQYFKDFYLSRFDHKIHLDVINPIYNKHTLLAILVLKCDPEKYLYPIIEESNLNFKNSECLIGRQNGDSVLFMSKLKFNKEQKLKFSLSLKNKNLPIAQGIAGKSGIVEGIDYAGNEVIANVQKIPETNWILVSKEKKSEVYGNLTTQMKIILSIGILIIAISVILGMLFYYSRQQKTAQLLYENEKKLHEEQKEFRTTLYSIADAVITFRKSGEIKNMNRIAEKLCGLHESEAIGKKLADVITIVDEKTLLPIEYQIDKITNEFTVNEPALLNSKTETKIPVFLSFAPIQNEQNERTGTVLVFHDQTNEYISKKKLIESEEKYRSIFEYSNNCIALHELVFNENNEAFDYRILDCNQAFTELTGIKKENAIGVLSTKIYHSENPPYFETYKRVAQSGYSEKFETHYSPLNKHLIINVISHEKNKFFTVTYDISDIYNYQTEILSLSNRNEAILSSVPDIIMEVNENKIYTWSNKAGYEFFGNNVIGKEASYYFEGEQNTYEIVQPLFEGKEEIIYVESYQRRKDGEKRLLAWWCKSLKDKEGNATGTLSTARDITEIRKNEELLIINEKLFRATFESSSIGKSLTNLNGNFIKVNQAFADMLGYSIEELEKISFYKITYHDDYQISENAVNKFISDDIKNFHFEKRYVHKNGTIIWVEIYSTLLRDINGNPLYFITNIKDITEKRKTDEIIKKSLAEKEVLLKEIHHRVKNNFQIINSLLNLQSLVIDDESVQNIFSNMRNRIRTMSLIHELMYRTEHFEYIDVKKYVTSLVEFIDRSMNYDKSNIEIELEIDELHFNIETIIPCGLIINELLSNAINHAFDADSQGKVNVSLKVRENSNIVLIIKDNGKGFTHSAELIKSKTFGLQMVDIFVKQLNGTLQFNTKRSGTEYKITFVLSIENYT